MTPSVETYEKLGLFYLGRPWDLAAGAPREGLTLYESKDLLTHAMCVGMTGSGKTGLCICLLEEAAIDGIPALVIDPKGDLGNLLLTFPDLSAASFDGDVRSTRGRDARPRGGDRGRSRPAGPAARGPRGVPAGGRPRRGDRIPAAPRRPRPSPLQRRPARHRPP
jgi:DNA helicase HerA-like ATPase